MSTDTFKEIRDECYSALASSWACDTPDMGPLLDDVFDQVTKTIRRRFGVSIAEAELILRDVRNKAEELFDEARLDDFVNLDQTIEAIAKHLAEQME